MLPFFPIPLFKQFIPPFLWALSPIIICCATLLYFSTVLTNQFYPRGGTGYYRYCSFSRPLSLLTLWLAWSILLAPPCASADSPLVGGNALILELVASAIIIASLTLYIISVKAIGLRQSFLFHAIDDPFVRNSVYGFVRHPQYWSSIGMISGIVVLKKSFLGAMCLAAFCLLLLAGALIEEKDMAKASLFSPWLLIPGIVGILGIFYSSWYNLERISPLIAPAKFGLTDDELFMIIATPVFFITSISFLMPLIYYSIRKEGKKAALMLNLSFLFQFLTVFAFLSGGCRDARNQGMFTFCKHNEKTIAQALQQYSIFHNRCYPDSIKELVPKILPSVPACPAAGKDTYSTGYRVSSDHKVFTIYCKGRNHSFWRAQKKVFLEDDHPAFDSIKGEIECR